jgi:hypothetical protein
MNAPDPIRRRDARHTQPAPRTQTADRACNTAYPAGEAVRAPVARRQRLAEGDDADPGFCDGYVEA